MAQVADEQKKAVAPPLDEIQLAVEDELVVDQTHRDRVVAWQTPNGWRKAIIHARDLSWEEQSRIGDRHTKVTTLGRQKRIDVDNTAIVRDMMLEAIVPEKCQPRLTKEKLRQLDGPLYQAIVRELRLDNEQADKEEERAGES